MFCCLGSFFGPFFFVVWENSLSASGVSAQPIVFLFFDNRAERSEPLLVEKPAGDVAGSPKMEIGNLGLAFIFPSIQNKGAKFIVARGCSVCHCGCFVVVLLSGYRSGTREQCSINNYNTEQQNVK